jgi:outer membrane protein
MNKLVFSCLVAFCLQITTVAAQKYGHMNMGNLLEALPAVTSANKELEMLGARFETRLDSVEKDLQTYYATVNQQANSGLLTRMQMEEAQKSLEVKQNRMKAETEVAEKAVADMRAKLLQPILQKVEDAIKAVAKENGYAMIFDTSVGATLFVADTDDVTALVNAKLK